MYRNLPELAIQLSNSNESIAKVLLDLFTSAFPSIYHNQEVQIKPPPRIPVFQLWDRFGRRDIILQRYIIACGLQIAIAFDEYTNTLYIQHLESEAHDDRR